MEGDGDGGATVMVGRSVSGWYSKITSAFFLLAILFSLRFGEKAEAQSRRAPEGCQKALSWYEGVGENQRLEFFHNLMNDMETVWSQILEAYKVPFRPAKLVIYEGDTVNSCVARTSEHNVIYCLADHRIYLNWRLVLTMEAALKEFAPTSWAIVLGHEMGHHVQWLLGVWGERGEMLTWPNQRTVNASGRIAAELQADCLAGVWVRHSFRGETIRFERQDLAAVRAVLKHFGDDLLGTQLSKVPEADQPRGHGSAKERVDWFNKGFKTGDPRHCTTVPIPRLEAAR